MTTRVEKVRLGVFLVVSSVVVAVVFITLAGIEFMTEPDVYHAHFNETVSGLEIGAQVKYNGVRVGQVAKIGINPKNIAQVTVLLELEQGTPVKVDTTAVLTSMGITGLKFVELTGGSDDAALLPEGGTMRTGRSFMGSIEGKAEDIAVKVELAVSKINAVLSENNISHINDIVINLKTMSARVNELVDTNDENVTTTISNLANISKELNSSMASVERSVQTFEEILTDSKPQISTLLSSLSKTSETINDTAQRFSQVDGVLRQLERTLASFNKEIQAVEMANVSKDIQNVLDETHAAIRSVRRIVEASRENIYESSVSLKSTMRNLDDLSSELRDQPSLLLRSKPPEDRTLPKKTRNRKQ